MLRTLYVDHEGFEFCKRCGISVNKENSPHDVGMCFRRLRYRIEELEDFTEQLSDKINVANKLREQLEELLANIAEGIQGRIERLEEKIEYLESVTEQML